MPVTRSQAKATQPERNSQEESGQQDDAFKPRTRGRSARITSTRLGSLRTSTDRSHEDQHSVAVVSQPSREEGARNQQIALSDRETSNGPLSDPDYQREPCVDTHSESSEGDENDSESGSPEPRENRAQARRRPTRVTKRKPKAGLRWTPEKPNIFITRNIPDEADACFSRDYLQPPDELLMPLLPFQKEFLAWGVSQEQGKIRGGILADEMGMGKTIQAISLIVTHREDGFEPNIISRKNSERTGQSSLYPGLRLKGPTKSTTQSCVAVSNSKRKKSNSHDVDTSQAGLSPGEFECGIGHFNSEDNEKCPDMGPGCSACVREISEQDFCSTTLVVCPMVAVLQWRDEIHKYVAPGTLRVYVHHGPKRTVDAQVLQKYDVVLTTYSIVESEYRRSSGPTKVECGYCGKHLHMEKLYFHLKYFCGPHSTKTKRQMKQQKKQKNIKDKKQSGNKRKLNEEEKLSTDGIPSELLKKWGDISRMSDRDRSIVEACIGMIAVVVKEAPVSKPQSVLHEVNWRRVILDEAHYIKDRRSGTARGVFALSSKYKWALTGTPLQNRVGEMYSLIRFLRVYPYAFYFCKVCPAETPCFSLDHQNSCSNPNCDHGQWAHFCWWNKFVANPIKKYGYTGDGHLAMAVLRTEILDQTVLRRTKLDCADVLALPPRLVVFRKDPFDQWEEDFYEAMYLKTQAQFGSYVAAGTLVHNYAHIFDMLMRLRQAVNHPYLVVHSLTANSHSLEDSDASSGMCGICHDSTEDKVSASCKHSFCRLCLDAYMADRDGMQVTCPVCDQPLSVNLSRFEDRKANGSQSPYRRQSILNRIDTSKFQTSTKIEALCEELYRMKEEDPSAKAIVFSQFTSMLELIEFRLHQIGIDLVRLDGSVQLSMRDKLIRSFSEDPSKMVFLMSLKAGGVALNLTAASHVMLMDPWWNPAMEQQAQDRIHRLGQYKPIKTTRFIIKGSIEERILMLQEKKQLIFEGTVGRNTDALGSLTVEDMNFLFG